MIVFVCLSMLGQVVQGGYDSVNKNLKARDSRGLDCSDETYDSGNICGLYDDIDFTANQMCYDCGGALSQRLCISKEDNNMSSNKENSNNKNDNDVIDLCNDSDSDDEVPNNHNNKKRKLDVMTRYRSFFGFSHTAKIHLNSKISTLSLSLLNCI